MEVREQRDVLLRRIVPLRMAFVLLLVAIGGAYWFVQVVQGSVYLDRAENNRLRKLAVQAPRGLIVDRHGRLLADNVPSYNLLVDLSQSADREASLDFAAGILGRDRRELEERLESAAPRSHSQQVLLAGSLSLAEVARFSVSALEHPEFEIEVGHLRLYRHGPMTAHVLGYMGEVSEEVLREADGRYRPGDLAGKTGLEKVFDHELRGVDGERQVVVDSRGRTRAEFASQPARPGRRLRLTLDLELQQRAARYFEDRVGAAVVLDPRNGDVLALVSAPSFNPNLFARRLDREEWQALVSAPHNPLQNRALQNTYSPGSLFKIAVAVAGLSDGVVSTGDSVHCSGATHIYNRRFRCWKRAGHGWVDLRKAIRESCDVYFYHLGQRLGITRLAHYARRFGLGRPTGIDLEEEKAGLVPDVEWSLEARGTSWYPGETISVAIGQGPLLATPLQIARMMAILANGGPGVTPRLDVERDAPRPRSADLDPAALETVRQALWAVVNERGTGAAARVPGMEIAGKTGTAQVVRQNTWVDSAELPYEQRDHAWFASFGPLDAPELVVVVFVEHGGKGSQAAAPLARQLYESYRDLRDTDRAS